MNSEEWISHHERMGLLELEALKDLSFAIHFLDAIAVLRESYNTMVKFDSADPVFTLSKDCGLIRTSCL